LNELPLQNLYSVFELGGFHPSRMTWHKINEAKRFGEIKLFFFLDRVACCATFSPLKIHSDFTIHYIPKRANCLQIVRTFQIMSSRFLPGSSNTLLGVILAAGIGTIVLEWVLIRPFRSKRRADERHPRFRRGPTDNLETNVVANNLTQLIGNTPLLRINCLSDLTGIEIWAKCEVRTFSPKSVCLRS